MPRSETDISLRVSSAAARSLPMTICAYFSPACRVPGATPAAAGHGPRMSDQLGSSIGSEHTHTSGWDQELRFRPPPPPIRADLSGNRQCSANGIMVDAYAPVLALARRLIRAGLPPDRILKVYRGATLCFCVPLAVAARLTVEDSSDGPPRFRQYRQPSWEVGPPIAPDDLAATPLAEPLQKTPSAG